MMEEGIEDDAVKFIKVPAEELEKPKFEGYSRSSFKEIQVLVKRKPSTKPDSMGVKERTSNVPPIDIIHEIPIEIRKSLTKAALKEATEVIFFHSVNGRYALITGVY